jgi:two-component system NtrC family sensor kinase
MNYETKVNTTPKTLSPNRRFSINMTWLRNIKIPIATKLILGFLLIIIIVSIVFMVVGTRLIRDRILVEAQEKVRNDLNVAREIYLGRLTHVDTIVQLTADRFFLRDALIAKNLDMAIDELTRVRMEEELDVLTVTDQYGTVLLRTSNGNITGDNQVHDEIIQAVISRKEPVASTIIISEADLRDEAPELAEKAYFKFIDTPLARDRAQTEETSGMMLKAAAPIFNQQNQIIGIVYGGVLLNRNYGIVDKVKHTVYENIKYKGKDIGTVTIFQDDLRISTNVMNKDGSRAIGTRVSEEVYNQVIVQGEPWIDRAYVVNNWYITAYEPIKNLSGRNIGILYVGVLEEKYLDIQKQTVITFLAITLLGAVISMAVSYFIAQRILIPINQLVSASKEIAQGNLDARVKILTSDELQYLGDSFNAMALALKKRDEQLKEFTTQRIMESERLALIGQLSANVAHELNNPLQGIVTYSHLLLEDDESRTSTKVSIEKIVGQANRCRDIIRGLLDFSRQRKPDKTLSDLNTVLNDCVSLLENQALFHNIQIKENLQKDLPMLICDPSQIERVFLNMIINAAEAMDGNGQLTLTTRHAQNDEFIEVEITDTGHGIHPEDREKIFDPFFTTKDVGHGTGLGLAISYGIIKAHQGDISVVSELEKGTSFIIKLPLQTAQTGSDNGKQS